jgi:hypothetical protein
MEGSHPRVVRGPRSACLLRLRRPSAWPTWSLANPFAFEEYGLEEAVRLRREWLLSDPARVDEVLAELKDRPLACWCRPDLPCHADTLDEIANGEVV